MYTAWERHLLLFVHKNYHDNINFHASVGLGDFAGTRLVGWLAVTVGRQVLYR